MDRDSAESGHLAQYDFGMQAGHKGVKRPSTVQLPNERSALRSDSEERTTASEARSSPGGPPVEPVHPDEQARRLLGEIIAARLPPKVGAIRIWLDHKKISCIGVPTRPFRLGITSGGRSPDELADAS